LRKGKERYRIKERKDRGKELMESQSWINTHTARKRITTRLNAER